MEKGMIGVCLEIRQHFIHSPARTPEAVPTFSMKPYHTLADLLDEEHPFDAGETVPARLAVIGFPIAHSKSPAMQQAALDAAGIHARYIRIQAAPEEFGEVVRLLRKGDSRGPTLRFPTSRRPVPCAVTRMPFPALPVPSILLFSNRTVPSPDSIRTVRGSPAPSGRNFPWICAI